MTKQKKYALQSVDGHVCFVSDLELNNAILDNLAASGEYPTIYEISREIEYTLELKVHDYD